MNCKHEWEYQKSHYGSEYDYRQSRYVVSLIFAIEETIKFCNTFHFKTIAIPYGLGCGLGGGNWEVVHSLIIDLSALNPNIKFEIWKLK